MRKIELAYLAGVMDSDGYFTIHHNTRNIRIIKDSKNPTHSEKCGIKQTQPQAIKLIHKNFGGYYRIEKSTAEKGKPLHSLSLTNQKAYKFIKAIYPFLRIKKAQVKILFRLRKSLNEGRKRQIIVYHKNRWGVIKPFKMYVLSKKQIDFRNSLIREIKSLNDIRPNSFLPE
jgi:hypothetical protein